jgi:hypothetical protein
VTFSEAGRLQLHYHIILTPRCSFRQHHMDPEGIDIPVCSASFLEEHGRYERFPLPILLVRHGVHTLSADFLRRNAIAWRSPDTHQPFGNLSAHRLVQRVESEFFASTLCTDSSIEQPRWDFIPLLRSRAFRSNLLSISPVVWRA